MRQDIDRLESVLHHLSDDTRWVQLESRLNQHTVRVDEEVLASAVLAYRSEYLVEHSLGRPKGRPLSLTPMYVQRDDHATGLIRLLSITLRVLALLEFVVRRQLAAEAATLAGLYTGNSKR